MLQRSQKRILLANANRATRTPILYPVALRHMSKQYYTSTRGSSHDVRPQSTTQYSKQLDQFDLVLKQNKSDVIESDGRSTVSSDEDASESQTQQMKANDSKKEESIFAHESTLLLMKKYFVYKLMGSDMFINHSLGMINGCYRVLGIPLTNKMVNNSVGQLFMSGETIEELMVDVHELEKKNINGLGGYAVEGLPTMNETKIQEFYECILESIDAQTRDGREGNFAIKFTGLISMDVLTRLSTSSDTFLYDILALDKMDLVSIQQLEQNLEKCGVNLTPGEIQTLFNSLKIDNDDNTQSLTRLDRYAKGHLLALKPDSQDLEKILRKITLQTGCTENDLQIFEKFSEKVWSIGEHANTSNCNIYVDAEQAYIQGAIESVGQQLTQNFNRGDKHTIVNGYQSYLKRMKKVITDEVACSKALGYNLGVKLVRGAYMREERSIAASKGIESPVCDTIEDTHASYNWCMEHVLHNLDEDSLLMIASHNFDTIEKAKAVMDKLNIKDRRVHFGQLKGFSDQITGSLAQQDYRVFKYVPFGPTETVLPYLVRRGQESRQVLREQEFQNAFLKAEIKGRLLPFGRRPPSQQRQGAI